MSLMNTRVSSAHQAVMSVERMKVCALSRTAVSLEEIACDSIYRRLQFNEVEPTKIEFVCM